MSSERAKRVFDVCLAGLAIVPGIAICACAAIAIRLDSPGPIVFRQQRYGRNGELFTLYKLRTMSIDTGDRPSHEVASSQITRVGKILRSTKFDEIPQLVNVLRGEMSLVGPRPSLPDQLELIAERQALGVDRLRPGITGPSQLLHLDMSTPAALASGDAAYLGRWSWINDMRILIKTVVGTGSGDAAGHVS